MSEFKVPREAIVSKKIMPLKSKVSETNSWYANFCVISKGIVCVKIFSTIATDKLKFCRIDDSFNNIWGSVAHYFLKNFMPVAKCNYSYALEIFMIHFFKLGLIKATPNLYV